MLRDSQFEEENVNVRQNKRAEKVWALLFFNLSLFKMSFEHLNI